MAEQPSTMPDEAPDVASAAPSSGAAVQQPARINQKEEAAKAIRFMAIKAAIFILIPVIASALAILFLL